MQRWRTATGRRQAPDGGMCGCDGSWDGSPVRWTHGGKRYRARLLDTAGLIERQARRAVENAGRIALAEVDEEVGTDGSPGEEGGIHLGRVEPGHRPGVQAE